MNRANLDLLHKNEKEFPRVGRALRDDSLLSSQWVLGDLKVGTGWRLS